MKIEYDEDKRSEVLAERGLDLAEAGKVFKGFHLTRWDEAHSQDEDRYQSVGLLDGIVVIVIWTERSHSRRIITMWKCNEKERERYFERRESS